RRYKVVANPKVYWHTKTLFHDEAEEEIWANVIDIGNHLIGLVSGPTGWRSHEHKTLNRKYRAGIEARLLLLEPQMTFSFMQDCMRSLHGGNDTPTLTSDNHTTRKPNLALNAEIESSGRAANSNCAGPEALLVAKGAYSRGN